jgi:hypothetical protein
MKKRKNQLLRFIWLLLLIQGTASIQAQMRVGGNIAPAPHAILDLNANDTIDGTMGLLLPRVALFSTASEIPLHMHVRGMFVFNTAERNDVMPGVYYNDGIRWIRSSDENPTPDVRKLEIPIDDTISTQSIIFYGKAATEQPADLKVLKIEPVFSDEIMAMSLFMVNSSAKPTEEDAAVRWSVRVSTLNIDSSRSSTLEKVVITYTGDMALDIISPTGTYILVGQ